MEPSAYPDQWVSKERVETQERRETLVLMGTKDLRENKVNLESPVIKDELVFQEFVDLLDLLDFMA